MDNKELDKYFNEVEEPDKDIFNKLTTSEELHYIAENHNWDNGIIILEWIIENKLCSEATALMIFWRAQPYDYTKYNYNAKSIKYIDIDIFNLIKVIIKNYENGFYKKTSIKYDPKEDMPKYENIPEIMFEETNGEEPYIYYDEKEVNSWFGEYFDNLLARCDNSMELYNIVYLLATKSRLEFSKQYKKLLEHKYCDKGIALFIYWKTKQYYLFSDMFEDYNVFQKIENKIISNECKEIIKYNPKMDKDNEINIKHKWKIPEKMKGEIK
ncbi:MAG: DUF4274 domain-containing protein [Azoarcus sp.]|jgi:hypothetical protein|nr:DUF4274 domain-containing protein [Azoarcus sp.]